MDRAEEERLARARPFSRRQLLKAGTGAAGLLVGQRYLEVFGGDATGATLLGPEELSAVSFGAPNFVVRTVRRDDMFAVDLRFVNLKVVKSREGPRLVRMSAAPAFVLLELPPQAVLEEAFPEGSQPPFLGSVGALLSGPSRLAFLVPAAVKYIPYRLDDVLDLARLRSSVVGPGQQRLPSPTETHIEAPWDLVLSPGPSAAWAHAVAPVTSGERTELWHTRLVPRRADGEGDDRPGAPPVPMRAVSRAMSATVIGKADPFPTPQTALPATRRDAIVAATSGPSANARPAEARRLHLSALGASLTVDGAWQGLAVDGWNHRSTWGRDHYVRVDTPGYLVPFGHRATLVEITERKFRPGGAYLFKREFIVVKRPIKDFPAFGQPDASRRMPLRRVTITDTVSPLIIGKDLAFPPAEDVFWPRVNVSGSPQDLVWSLVGEDLEGRTLPFSMPLLFVERGNQDTGAHGARGAAVTVYFQSLPNLILRTLVDLQGRAVAFAPPGNPGDTSLEVRRVLFGAESSVGVPPASLLNADQPNLYPFFREAVVDLPAVKGIKGPGAEPTSISYFSGYQAGGFGGSNTRSVYVRPIFPQSLSLPAATVGGVAAPNLNLIGLSRELGAVSADVTSGVEDALNALNAEYDPAEYFPPEAKLLGSLTLKKVLLKAAGALPPALLNEKLYPPGLPPDPLTGLPHPDQVPDAIRTTLRFRPLLQPFPPAGAAKAFIPRDINGLELVVTLVAKVAGPTESSATIRGSLRDFELRLPPAASTADAAIAVFFDRLAFVSENGAKPNFDVALRDLSFGGPLTFVQDLREFLKSPGSGLSIDIGPDGIAAGYTLALPPISVGIFALQNVALSAGVELPFDDRPVRLRFAFCSRERPFLLTFSLFGGGGFFAVKVSSNGLELVEAALEFGAAASLNLGVASGSVSVMAGIYFKLEIKDGNNDVSLGGYLRLNGSLEVLGLITISVEFYMGFTYESATEKVVGRATLTVKVSVLFFSASVSLSVERKFGGGGDPPFGEMVSRSDWDDYCDAFAEVS
jgi:hypothetical protein